MMFFVDSIMGFLYGHPLFRKFIFYILVTALVVVAGEIWILYNQTGEYILSPHILFDDRVVTLIIDTHRKTIYKIIIIEHMIFLALLYWMNAKLKSRANCSVKYLHIEDIATGWLQTRQVRENIKKELALEVEQQAKIERPVVAPPIAVSFQKQRSNEIFSNIISTHHDKIPKEEVNIIIELLGILENQGDIPSVVSYTAKDSENKYKAEILTEDGMTSYRVLSDVSLYDHTMNVVEKIYEELKRHSKTNYVLLLGKAIIAALAHDIGKIKKMEERIENVSLEIFSSQPHHLISKIFFMRMYPHYPDRKIIIEAIENHHASKIQGGNELVRLLVSADKGAREGEIDSYFKGEGQGNRLIRKETEKKAKADKKTNHEEDESVEDSGEELPVDLHSDEVQPAEEELQKQEKKKKRLLSDIDIEDDYRDLVKPEPKTELVGGDEDGPVPDANEESAKDEKEKKTAAKKESPKKHHKKSEAATATLFSEERSYEVGGSWDIATYENAIIENLSMQINKATLAGFKNTIHSVSYKDMVLFSFATVQQAIEEAVGYEIDSRDAAMQFIKEYRSKGEIGYVDTENNYYTSKFYIIEGGKNTEFDAVPIFARVFELTEDDLDRTKAQNQLLKKIDVKMAKDI